MLRQVSRYVRVWQDSQMKNIWQALVYSLQLHTDHLEWMTIKVARVVNCGNTHLLYEWGDCFQRNTALQPTGLM